MGPSKKPDDTGRPDDASCQKMPKVQGLLLRIQSINLLVPSLLFLLEVGQQLLTFLSDGWKSGGTGCKVLMVGFFDQDVELP